MKRFIYIIVLVFAVVIPQRTLAQQLWGTTLRGGAGKGGTIFKVNADNSSYVEAVHEFTLDNQAQNPIGPMVLAANNKFYGVCQAGGASDQGSIFEFDPATQIYATKWEFTAPDRAPGGGLMKASNGLLYGVCSVGGTSGGGIIYSFNITTGVFTRVFSFSNSTAHGTTPTGELVEGTTGKLYGVNKDGGSPGNSGTGVLYEYNFNTQVFTKLYSFTAAGGTRPTGGVIIDAGGKFYGITISNGASKRGTLYSFDKGTSTFAEIHEFKNNDGAQPLSTPIKHSNGKIYGTALGDNDLIYEYDPAPAGTGFLIKDHFVDNSTDGTSPGGFCEAPNGKLYVPAIATGINIIQFDPVAGTATVVVSNLPVSMGARAGNAFAVTPTGNLCTTFTEGGATGAGSVVRYSPVSNVAQKMYDMAFSTSGAYPYGDLVKAGNGKLYGMLSVGGNYRLGLIFEIDPVTGVFTKKFDFDGPNGATPLGGMILSSNGKLYGTTTFGGPSSDERSFQDNPLHHNIGARGHGVLFEYDPATNTYVKKLDFNTTVGTNPYGKPVEGSNGKLYGVTSMDGALGGGTLYEYVIDGAITKYYDFPAPAGASGNTGPKCQLVELDGKLYGTTPFLGTNNGGSLFEFDIASNTLTTRASFSMSTNNATTSVGSNPNGGLVIHVGKLYGVTSNGGPNGGTLYEYTPGATTVIKKLDLPTDAIGAIGALVAQGGKLYGTFSWSPNLNGGAFEYDPATNVFTRKFQFSGANGASPQWGSLVVVSGKSGQFINFPQPTTEEFGVTPAFVPFISVPTTSSVGLPITYTSSNLTVAHTNVAGRITQVGAGTTIITATQAGTDTYDAVSIARTVTILMGHQTLNWPPPIMTPKLSIGTVTLAATSSSGLPVVYTSSNTDVATVEGNVMTPRKAGSVVIVASQPGTDSYLPAASISMPFAIQRGDQAITFLSIPAKEVADVSFTLVATSTSQLPISFASSDPQVATVSGNVVTIIKPGTTNITASQAGDTNWNPATSVAQQLVVNKMSQTITFDGPEAKTLGTAPFTVSASATSGLPVTFSTTTSRITISGTTVTVLVAGPASITASQTGNASYKEATQVTRTFCVNPAKPAVTTATNSAGFLVLTTPLTGSLQWYLNGEALTLGNGPTYVAELPGTYTVVIDALGCKSAPSDPVNVIVTEVRSEISTTVSHYPNPVSDILHILIPDNKGSRLSIIGTDGRVMEDMYTPDEDVSVNVSDYSPGLYLLRVGGEVRRFLKR